MASRAKADRALLQWQKNQVFELVRGFGFDPGDFRWELVESPLTPRTTIDRLAHVSSDYFFAFDLIPPPPYSLGMEEDRASYFSPGADRLKMAIKSFGWDSQLEVVRAWLQALKREVETVSLWESFGREPIRELAEGNLSNKPLDKDQQREVQLRVARVRAYLRETVDDPERLARVEKKLDDVIDASKRLGRKDFANTALGVLMTIAVDAALRSDQAQQLINLFATNIHLLLK